MHTYRVAYQRGNNTFWGVYFWDGANMRPINEEFPTEAKAAGWASYLNGGSHPAKPWPAEVI
jgi:hypothetical protein